jgi:hypothetical protein
MKICHRRTLLQSLNENKAPADDHSDSQAVDDSLLVALRAEDRIRVGHEGQLLFRLAEMQHDTDWLEVAEQIQVHALLEAGLEADEYNLARLRDAALRNPSIARYVRLNRLRQGDLCVGDTAPNVPLAGCSATANATSLHSLFDKSADRPIVVFAGSYS